VAKPTPDKQTHFQEKVQNNGIHMEPKMLLKIVMLVKGLIKALKYILGTKFVFKNGHEAKN